MTVITVGSRQLLHSMYFIVDTLPPSGITSTFRGLFKSRVLCNKYQSSTEPPTCYAMFSVVQRRVTDNLVNMLLKTDTLNNMCLKSGNGPYKCYYISC